MFGFRTVNSLALLCLAGLAFPSLGADGDTVLITGGDVTVTRADVERFVEFRIPERQRAAALSRPGAVRELVAQIYITRSLAREAEGAEGLDQESMQWQMDIQNDRVRMEALIAKRVAEEAARSDWEKLAREHYTAKRPDFEVPERVRASHVLIRTGERSEEEAEAIAREIAERARAGEDFVALVEEYSEDPSATGNQGDLGFFQRGQMVPEFEEAAFALQNEGDIAGPVKTQFGYHVIRFQERRAAHVRSFDNVKDSIVRDLRERQAGEVRQAEIERVRAAEGIVVDQEAVETLEAELRVDVGAMIREQRGAPQGE